MKRFGQIPLAACAALAWLAILCAAIAYMRGGARRADDYVARAVRGPLPEGSSILATDEGNAFWSGWAPEKASGSRLAFVMDPDIAFLRASAATGCVAAIAAAPTAGPSQRVYLTLNGKTPPVLLKVDHDGTYSAPLAGGVVGGINTIAFRLPDAQPIVERMRSIALRSLTLTCQSSAPDSNARSRAQ